MEHYLKSFKAVKNNDFYSIYVIGGTLSRTQDKKYTLRIHRNKCFILRITQYLRSVNDTPLDKEENVYARLT